MSASFLLNCTAYHVDKPVVVVDKNGIAIEVP